MLIFFAWFKNFGLSFRFGVQRVRVCTSEPKRMPGSMRHAFESPGKHIAQHFLEMNHQIPGMNIIFSNSIFLDILNQTIFIHIHPSILPSWAKVSGPPPNAPQSNPTRGVSIGWFNRDPFNGLLYSLCNWVVSLVFQLVVGWTNPSWKICASQIGSFPQRGMDIKRIFETTQFLIRGSQFTFTYFNEKKTWLLSIHWFFIQQHSLNKTTNEKNQHLCPPTHTHTLNETCSKFLTLKKRPTTWSDHPPPYKTPHFVAPCKTCSARRRCAASASSPHKSLSSKVGFNKNAGNRSYFKYSTKSQGTGNTIYTCICIFKYIYIWI